MSIRNLEKIQSFYQFVKNIEFIKKRFVFYDMLYKFKEAK